MPRQELPSESKFYYLAARMQGATVGAEKLYQHARKVRKNETNHVYSTIEHSPYPSTIPELVEYLNEQVLATKGHPLDTNPKQLIWDKQYLYGVLGQARRDYVATKNKVKQPQKTQVYSFPELGEILKIVKGYLSTKDRGVGLKEIYLDEALLDTIIETFTT